MFDQDGKAKFFLMFISAAIAAGFLGGYVANLPGNLDFRDAWRKEVLVYEVRPRKFDFWEAWSMILGNFCSFDIQPIEREACHGLFEQTDDEQWSSASWWMTSLSLSMVLLIGA